MGAHIQNLEASIDNIWEDFVKLAQGTYSVSYIHYHPIWASWQKNEYEIHKYKDQVFREKNDQLLWDLFFTQYLAKVVLFVPLKKRDTKNVNCSKERLPVKGWSHSTISFQLCVSLHFLS